MKQGVVEAAEVTIGTEPGRRTERKEWWWSEVRQALKRKQEGFQEMEKIRTGGRQGGIQCKEEGSQKGSGSGKERGDSHIV